MMQFMRTGLTIKEFAAEKRVDPRTVRRWIAQGNIEIHRTPGGQIRIPPNGQYSPLILTITEPEKPWQSRGGVYFIFCQGFIKIGYANDIQKRLAQITTHNPLPLKPLGFVPCSTDEESEQVEQELHQRFANLRVRCEWFRDDKTIRDYICGHCSTWPPFRRDCDDV